MKHHPDLFNARTMYNDTRLLFKLKLELGTVCAYGGEIPLSVSELAKRLNTSSYRIQILLTKLQLENIVRYDENGKLFLTKFKYFTTKEKSTQEDLYAKNFLFFTCEEFQNEDRNVQRFVLHYVGHELVYLNKSGFVTWGHVKDLYGEEGLLNIRTPKEALNILEKAKKYLHIRVSDNQINYRVSGVRKEWLEMGERESEGSLLWVRKQLKKHRFCFDFLSDKAVIQIAKVMEHYYATYGYEYAVDVFDTALFNIQKNKMRSTAFYNLIYRENDEYEESELDEISAYFRSVMESAEITYARELSKELRAYEAKQHQAEMHLFKDDELVEKNEEILETARKQREKTIKKLGLVNSSWLKRFKKQPEWFMKYRTLIESLSYPIVEIKREIAQYLIRKQREAWASEEDELVW